MIEFQHKGSVEIWHGAQKMEVPITVQLDGSKVKQLAIILEESAPAVEFKKL